MQAFARHEIVSHAGQEETELHSQSLWQHGIGGEDQKIRATAGVRIRIVAPIIRRLCVSGRLRKR